MRVAVIGTGISGLGAAWLLDQAHETVVYEADGRIGGHSNTVDVPNPLTGGTLPVDTGFIVYNHRTYPNLIRLFETLGVETDPSNMSFGVSLGEGELEYASGSPLNLFAQGRNLLRPSHYRMLREILRFHLEASALLEFDDRGPTLGEYLDERGFADAFVDRHLLPMGAAIWSATPERIMAFPARSFARFLDNHGLLSLRSRPRWMTVRGGSRAYVERITAGFADRIRVGHPVVAIERQPTGVRVRDARGGEDVFDQVVVAAHADQALAMLVRPTPAERRVLGSFHYSANEAVLHADPALMPRRRRAWASWNYLAPDFDPDAQTRVSVTYWMNRLQNIDHRVPVFVSLNPTVQPSPQKVFRTFHYDHPQFDTAAERAQGSVPLIQGADRVWFCGSYLGWGFHEDGLASGLAVAEALGAPCPWAVADQSPAAGNATPAPERMVAAE